MSSYTVEPSRPPNRYAVRVDGSSVHVWSSRASGPSPGSSFRQAVATGGSDTAGDGAMLGDVGGSLVGVAGAVVDGGAAVGDAGVAGDCVVPPQAEIASIRTAPTTTRRIARS